MGLETGSFIEDLVDTNPAGTDQKFQGDDHIRLVKKCIQGSFPGGQGAWNFPTEQPIFQSVDVEAVNAKVINQCRQVAVAGARIDGALATILGNSFGILQVQRIGTGDYEIQLGTQIVANDFGIAVDVNFGIAYGMYIKAAPTVNAGDDWFKIRTIVTAANGSQTLSDPVDFGVIVFDYGRGLS